MEKHFFRYLYKEGQTFSFFLSSDHHLEDSATDLAALRADFERGRAENARAWLNGDIFSLILPKDMKRYTAANDEFPHIDAKINAIVQYAENVLAPYVDMIDMIGCGNHETAVLKHHAVDPTMLLIGFLNRRRDPKLPPIRHGGYTGFIRVLFEQKGGGHVQSYDVYYNHGAGKGGEVSGGSIELQRRSTWVAADAIWQGHIHKNMSDKLAPLIGIDRLGNFYKRERRGIITGPYRKAMEATNATDKGYRLSFPEETQRVPEGEGGAILRLTVTREGVRARVET